MGRFFLYLNFYKQHIFFLLMSWFHALRYSTEISDDSITRTPSSEAVPLDYIRLIYIICFTLALHVYLRDTNYMYYFHSILQNFWEFLCITRMWPQLSLKICRLSLMVCWYKFFPVCSSNKKTKICTQHTLC